MQRLVRFGVLLIVLALIGATPATAQNTSGAIAGTIADTQGGVLPGVTLTVTNAETGVARSSVTEADGKYRLRVCSRALRPESRTPGFLDGRREEHRPHRRPRVPEGHSDGRAGRSRSR
jgi:hypothetical protein